MIRYQTNGKSGSVYDLDNYRGITLSSNVYKLFSKTLETHIVGYLESNNIIGDSQGAFRKDRRIEDHIFPYRVYVPCHVALKSLFI